MLKGKGDRIRFMKKRKYTIRFLMMSFLFIFFVTKIFMGSNIGNDETCTILMGDRFLKGDILLKDSWWPLMGMAFITAPLIQIYKIIFGSMEGILVFFRFCGVVIHFSIALYLYNTIKRLIKKQYAMVAFLLFLCLIQRGTISISSYTCILYWSYTLVLLYLTNYVNSIKDKYLYYISITMLIGTLAFPTLIMAYILIIPIVWKYSSSSKIALVKCMGGYIVGGMLVITYICARANFNLDVIVNGISQTLQEEAHHVSVIWKMAHIYPCYILFSVYGLIALIVINKFVGIKYSKHVLGYLMFGIWVLGLLGIYMLRWQTANAFRLWYSFSILILWPYYFEKKASKDLEIPWLRVWRFSFIPISLIIVLASNGGINTNTVCLAFLLLYLIFLWSYSEETYFFDFMRAFLVVVMGVELIFVTDNYFSNNQINTVFAKRSRIEQGIAKGLYFRTADEEWYSELYSSLELLKTDGNLLFIDVFATSGYLMAEANFAPYQPDCIDLQSERLVGYFDQNEKRIPDKIVINKNVLDDAQMDFETFCENEKLGRYIVLNYDLGQIQEISNYIIIQR